jgi:hypothetical protein
LRMDKSGELGDLVRGEWESRHPLIGPAMQHDIPDLVSAYVGSHQLRPGEVGARFSAAGIPAVTERAILLEEGTAGSSQLGSLGGRRIATVGGSSVLRCRGSRRLARCCINMQLPALVGSYTCDHRQHGEIPKSLHPCDTTFIPIGF